VVKQLGLAGGEEGGVVELNAAFLVLVTKTTPDGNSNLSKAGGVHCRGDGRLAMHLLAVGGERRVERNEKRLF
jgi:hypothetical protein